MAQDFQNNFSWNNDNSLKTKVLLRNFGLSGKVCLLYKKIKHLQLYALRIQCNDHGNTFPRKHCHGFVDEIFTVLQGCGTISSTSNALKLDRFYNIFSGKLSKKPSMQKQHNLSLFPKCPMLLLCSPCLQDKQPHIKKLFEKPKIPTLNFLPSETVWKKFRLKKIL